MNIVRAVLLAVFTLVILIVILISCNPITPVSNQAPATTAPAVTTAPATTQAPTTTLAPPTTTKARSTNIELGDAQWRNLPDGALTGGYCAKKWWC